MSEDFGPNFITLTDEDGNEFGPSYNLHRFLAGGLSPACFTASNFQPRTAAGRPANHILIRHPL